MYLISLPVSCTTSRRFYNAWSFCYISECILIYKDGSIDSSSAAATPISQKRRPSPMDKRGKWFVGSSSDSVATPVKALQKRRPFTEYEVQLIVTAFKRAHQAVQYTIELISHLKKAEKTKRVCQRVFKFTT